MSIYIFHGLDYENYSLIFYSAIFQLVNTFRGFFYWLWFVLNLFPFGFLNINRIFYLISLQLSYFLDKKLFS